MCSSDLGAGADAAGDDGERAAAGAADGEAVVAVSAVGIAAERDVAGDRGGIGERHRVGAAAGGDVAGDGGGVEGEAVGVAEGDRVGEVIDAIAFVTDGLIQTGAKAQLDRRKS